MSTSLCPFVDDALDEATALAEQLKGNGFPFNIQPIIPDTTTEKTFQVINAAKPKAVIVDYFLAASPHVETPKLAAQLIRGGIPAVLVTKDRDIADGKMQKIGGTRVPIYSKKLFKDAQTFKDICRSLNIILPVPPSAPEDFARLSALQNKAFLSRLTPKERSEAELLEAHLRLIERAELGRVEATRQTADKKFEELLKTMQKLREDLARELGDKKPE